MALRGTLTHWKTRVLASALGIDPCCALGVLEALWHTTAELAPAGNIGRLPNKAIAMEMFYTGDADKLIQALTESGHLDPHPDHRLVVHQWSRFADDAVDNKLARSATKYADGAMPRMKRLSVREREHAMSQFEVPCESVRTESHINPPPAPESVPVPAPVPEPVKKPSRGEREVDPRSAEFKYACEAYYAHKSLVMTWDGSEAKQLAALFVANPTLNLEQFHGILRNRSHSTVNHAERPRSWLSRATDYAAGPLDKFGKPLEAGDAGRTFHHAKSKSAQVLDDLKRSLEEDGLSPGFGSSGHPQTGEPGQGHDGPLRHGPDGDARGGRSLGLRISLLPPAS